MFCGKYKFAEIVVEICSIYDQVQKMCRDYISDEEAQMKITVTSQMIDFERGDSDYDDAYLETLAVYRAFCEKAIEQNVLLFHGSAVAVDNEAYVFAAKSGTGKSTHVSFWQELLGDRAVVINDDKPLIRIKDDKAFVYGSPWQGKHDKGNNVSFPLKAVCFLERGGTNEIFPVSFSAAYPKLCKHSYYKDDKAYLLTLFSLFDKMKQVSFYEMKCKPDLDSARMAYETMKG
ncbi:MAG: hypothetical protein IJS17_01660 [Clostridia bacterium]|nr:hypothetical protein [Clostridia bacterium]